MPETRFERHPYYRKEEVTDKAIAWTIRNSPFEEYLEDFSSVIDPWYVEFDIARLSHPVIIDLMATPFALRDIHTNYLKSGKMTGIAVGLSYERNKLIEETEEEDLEMGIHYVAGNLRTSQTWGKIEEKLAGKKADYIMERAFGGLYYIPNNLSFYQSVLARSWEMLDVNGTLLLQTPPLDVLNSFNIPMLDWLKQVTESGIDALFCNSYRSRDGGEPYGMLSLTKNPHNSKLPILAKPTTDLFDKKVLVSTSSSI